MKAPLTVKTVKVPRRKKALPDANAWVELFPSGISVQSGFSRPVLILKDKAGNEVLPVWMHPLDAGVAVAEMSEASGLTPHAVTKRVLEMVGMQLDTCTFVELVGHHQYIQLTFKALDSAKTSENVVVTEPKMLRLRADEAMSFCLQAKARFYCTKELMNRCRQLDAEITQLEQGLSSGALSQLQSELENSSKKQPYMM